jgi:RecB family exonuclease
MPRMMRIDDFYRRVALVPGRSMVDPMQRVLLLREAADFEEFSKLAVNRAMVRFFTRSGDFFRFFEEIAWEGVAMDELARADAYAEYAEHLEILERLRDNYREILRRRGWTDRMFWPEEAEIHEGFLRNFVEIVIHVEGYPSRFELELMGRVARRVPLRIRLRSTPFNRKVLERFAERGIVLPENSEILFDLGNGEILEAFPAEGKVEAEVLKVQERYEQIALAFQKIQEMVDGGIAPERIALILPDEGMAEVFALFDRMENLNFAMGFDFRRSPYFRILDALERWWRSYDETAWRQLERYGVRGERLDVLVPTETVMVEEFFLRLEGLGLPEGMGEEAERKENALQFCRLFVGERFTLREWLFLWLRRLESLRLADIRGGKVTAMGVLETRGIAFDGVVIVDFNEGTVPAATGKDRFLDSRVREFAGLPGRQDREALQKQYYFRLMERAGRTVILYAGAESRLPSRFLYELGLEEGEAVTAPRELLYLSEERSAPREEIVVDSFAPEALVWSPSMLKSWLKCRRQFFYRYLEKLPEPEEEGLNEGRFLHSLFQRLYEERDGFGDEETMLGEIRRLMGEMLPDSSENAYHRGLWESRLLPFIREEIRHFAEGWRVEARELSVGGEIDGMRFQGRIDRIDRRGEERMLIDYKSGFVAEAIQVKDPEKLTDFQMSIYHALLRERYPILRTTFIRLFEEPCYQDIPALEEKNEWFMKRLAELRSTRRFKAEKCEKPQECRYCPYQLLCERGEYL